MLSFKPTFSFFSFTFIQRFFSSSLLSAIRLLSSAYLRLLIFLPAILSPVYASSSLAFLMMYSAYKLNKQGDNIQPWHTPFPIWNQSVFPRSVLTVASWPAYRFHKRQVRYSHLLNNFPEFVVIHRVKSFGIVNKAEVDIFLALSCVFDDPRDVGNLISGSSAFSKSSLNMWKLKVDILLKPGVENFEHFFTSVWDECDCVLVWTFLGIAFLWDWNENWPSSVLWPLLNFPNLLACWMWHLHSIIFRIWNSSAGILSPPLALFVVMLPKAHLTLHSRMSGSWVVIPPSWLSGSWRSFLYSSSVYSCYLFLISSAFVRSIPSLSFIVPIFAWNVPLVSLISLKKSLVFPILFSSISWHWSLFHFIDMLLFKLQQENQSQETFLPNPKCHNQGYYQGYTEVYLEFMKKTTWNLKLMCHIRCLTFRTHAWRLVKLVYLL